MIGIPTVKIGILAVQGDFEAHAAMLEGMRVDTVEVRTPADLEGCDGLILPGGESTTQVQFLREEGLSETIKRFAADGHAVFGTCAGAILLATDVQNPKKDALVLLDMTILRNGYGRQIASDVFTAKSTLKNDPLEMVFIRGPIIDRTGAGVEILARHAGKPAMVQKGRLLATTFHPELTSDPTVHEYFVKLAAESAKEHLSELETTNAKSST